MTPIRSLPGEQRVALSRNVPETSILKITADLLGWLLYQWAKNSVVFTFLDTVPSAPGGLLFWALALRC
jgi:hypothetical protein